jgi:hypothetical protein
MIESPPGKEGKIKGSKYQACFDRRLSIPLELQHKLR